MTASTTMVKTGMGTFFQLESTSWKQKHADTL
jgi:hypothetical protein